MFDGGESATHALAPERLGYVHVVKGEAVVDGHRLVAGDALRYRDETVIAIERGTGAELLVFDLPPLD